MQRSSYKVVAKASLSLASMLRRRVKKLAPNMAIRSAGFRGAQPNAVRKEDLVSLLLETTDESDFTKVVPTLGSNESLDHLGENIYSASVSLDVAERLLKLPSVKRLQTKKKATLHLDAATTDISIRSTLSGPRVVQETGKGVLIGIVDSGFDLSHPMFRDSAGKLRVDGLLDQTTNQQFTTAQLQAQWNGPQNPAGPGGDDDGHGTHVATIAGGTKFKGFEGVAPGARFLLVKTNFVDTANAVRWVFNKAGTKPCVINMSLGHHWGAHDGTEVEERLHERLVGRGKVIVVSAGNERADQIHIGGRFVPGSSETVGFRVLRQPPPDAPFAVVTLWYSATDTFDVELISPSGQVMSVPSTGNVDQFSSSQVDLELGRSTHAGPTPAIKVQMQLAFHSAAVSNNFLNNWKLRIRCTSATVGRIDGWFNNSGYGEFKSHALVESARTIGLPATGKGCIAVASHVTDNAWKSDDGNEIDQNVLIGRSSPFSSMGPTRDERQKPEISAPGQYLTSGLAANSTSSEATDRALNNQRLLTIEGTSMAAPMVTGAVALLLQKKRTLTADAIRGLLASAARVDAHSGAVWNPTYGFGKLDIAKALSLV